MPGLTWEEVLKRDDLVGGDIESHEGGDVYRGPLSGIRVEGDLVHFDSLWCARLADGVDGWEPWNITSSFVNMRYTNPIDIGEGRIHFVMPFLGNCTIFPKGGSKLDPAKVRGLVL